MSENVFKQEPNDPAISQDNQLLPPPIPEKQEVCNLVWLQLGCVLAIVFMVAAEANSCMPSEFAKFIVLGLLLSILFVGIATLIRISLKSPQLKGRLGAFFMIGLSGFFIYNLFVYKVPRARHYMPWRVVCGTNLKGLGTALQVYANDYDGTLPSDNWCDRLIEEADVSPRSFTCPKSDSIEGESDYCLNQFAAGKKLAELPADMVLLFECTFIPAGNQTRQPIRNRPNFNTLEITNDIYRGDEEVYLNCWNRIGGPELLSFSRHETGCNVLFADGHTEFVELSKLAQLQWDTEGKVKLTIPEAEIAAAQAPKKPTFFFPFKKRLMQALLLSSLIATVCLVIRFGAAKYADFIACIGALSAATGWLFGGWSEAAYVSQGLQGKMGGVVFGLLVGLCFGAVMTGMLERTRRLKAIVLFYTACGMIAGVICSTLVHLGLMIFYAETNPFGIMIGIPYGIFAGAVLGCLSGLAVKILYLRQTIEPEAQSIDAAS